MDFLDNAISKAKEAMDIAYKKTNEVVNTQKQRFDAASIESKRAKDFEKLGKLYFEMIKNTEIEDEAIKKLVDDISYKNGKIDELKKEINNAKNKKICPACSSSIDKASVFCSNCGAKLEMVSEEDE